MTNKKQLNLIKAYQYEEEYTLDRFFHTNASDNSITPNEVYILVSDSILTQLENASNKHFNYTYFDELLQTENDYTEYFQTNKKSIQLDTFNSNESILVGEVENFTNIHSDIQEFLHDECLADEVTVKF